jgi:hypothetical protein
MKTNHAASSTFSVRCSTFNVLLTVSLLLSVASAGAAVRYVDAASPSPKPPYTNWPTAARVIQDAVDVAAPGEEIVVTNGLYATGGRAVAGTETNRVAVDKPLVLRSVNGPEVTVIQGDGATRCVYLTNAASLCGFTLTNGSGGVNSEASGVVSNCVITGNAGRGAGGGTLYNCILSGNSDGGAAGCTLNNCTLTGNSALDGGGAYDSTLNNCTLNGNLAFRSGGGAYESTLNNCTLTGNSAGWAGGGGAYGGTLNNCTLTANWARRGGGAYGGRLNNCTLAGNSARDSGGGPAGAR